jgi:hypothetical protein
MLRLESQLVVIDGDDFNLFPFLNSVWRDRYAHTSGLSDSLPAVSDQIRKKK